MVKFFTYTAAENRREKQTGISELVKLLKQDKHLNEEDERCEINEEEVKKFKFFKQKFLRASN